MSDSETGFNLLTIAVLIGGFNGVFFGLLLLKLRPKNIAANRFLAIILVTMGLLMLGQYFIESGLIYQYPYLLGNTFVLEVLFAPSIYLYVRNMTQPLSPLHKTWMHFIPSGVAALLIMPFYFLNFDQRLAVVSSDYLDWPGVLEITQPIYMLITGIQFVIYLVLSFKLLFQHTHNIKQFFSYKENITMAWLRNFLLLNVLMFIFYLIFMVFYSIKDSQIGVFMDWFYYLSVGIIFYLGIMGMFQRRIYKDDMAQLDLTTQELIIEAPKSNEAPAEKADKYKKSALSKEMSDKLLIRLERTMEQEEPYLNSSLTLPQLAKMVATSPNNLSQVINEQLSMKFFDYINSYRIEVAKKLLANPLPHTPTILDIAMEAAFNSKSAFYSAFKKQVGVTPASFKKHIENSDM